MCKSGLHPVFIKRTDFSENGSYSAVLAYRSAFTFPACCRRDTCSEQPRSISLHDRNGTDDNFINQPHLQHRIYNAFIPWQRFNEIDGIIAFILQVLHQHGQGAVRIQYECGSLIQNGPFIIKRRVLFLAALHHIPVNGLDCEYLYFCHISGLCLLTGSRPKKKRANAPLSSDGSGKPLQRVCECTPCVSIA